MANANIRMSEELYEEVRRQAETEGISISDFIRESVKQRLYNAEHSLYDRSFRSLHSPSAMPQAMRETPPQAKPLVGRKTEHNAEHAEEKGRLYDLLKKKESHNEELTRQLVEANERADEANKRHDTIVLTLTQQLDRANLALEDHRNRSWWERLFYKNVR